MKKHLVPMGAVALLALFVAGCEYDSSTAARIQEKSAVYATLQVWQKRYIEKGVIDSGFTPDMVYMAMGHPSKVETKPDPGGGRMELWTYGNYYPPLDAGHMNYVPVSGESVYRPSFMMTYDGRQVPYGFMGLKPSIGTTGPPQGGTGEPAALQSYTFYIVFKNGKVSQFSANPNPN